MDRKVFQRVLILGIILTNTALIIFLAGILIGGEHTGKTASAAGTQESTLYVPLVSRPISKVPISVPVAVVSSEPISVSILMKKVITPGYEIVLNKIGFHTGIDGNTEGLDEWMAALDAAGIPIFLKSADNAEPLYKAQLLAEKSSVPHVLVYRKTGLGYDIPNYDATPAQAAEAHWILHRKAFPPELDPSLVWIETVNEVDKGRSEWLASFALETAKLAIADGFKWAAFGWASGTPEPEHWQTPAMLKFLRFAGDNPEFVAIALHEYSYIVGDIGAGYPFLIGRFQELFRICDLHHIKRPTVLITEWGWEYENVPEPVDALTDIKWASWLYAGYPNVQGAAIWYLGGNFDDIADLTQKLIAPSQEYSLMNYFVRPTGIGLIDTWLYQPTPPPPIYHPTDHPLP